MLRKITLADYSAEPSDAANVQEPSYVSLDEVWQFIRRHWEIFATSVAVPVAFAFIYCVTTPAVFTARAQLLIDPQTPQPMQQVSANTGIVTYDSPQVESQIAVLLSDSIARSVVQDQGLDRDPEFGGSLTPPDSEADKLAQRQRVIEVFDNALDVRREGLSYAISISFNSRDPVKAANIANAIANAYIKDQLAARADAVRAGSDWLEERINSIRKEMNEAALRVQEFKVKRDYRIAPDPAIDKRTPDKVDEPQTSLDELETTATTFKRIYESYLQAYTESVQRQSFPVSNARVITSATPPRVKSKPKTLLILFFAALLGTLTGVGIALYRERTRT